MRTERFEGTIGRTLAESTPWFDPPPDPGPDAPDVLVILLDDTGFAQLGCFGSDIDTPHIDALAADGVQFTNFHVTPLCSPTRAALLTGRSHHAAGMRGLSNFRTGFPHMLGHVSTHTATMAEVLSDEGYATFAVGKWHLAPMEECSAAGPFDQWPLGRGFDRFYGFLDGETDQFHPSLTVDNHHIEPPAGPEDGYHLTEDLVDRALEMITASTNVRPDRPIFTWFALGATHAPHQAPAEHLAKYRGRYDEGWDVVRARWFERQKELGVVPAHTTLAPRNPGVAAWDDLPETERRLAARLQEAFAAFLDHTDDQIGRLLDGLRDLGRLDNTIVLLMADNGASQEGGPYGVMHEMKFFNGILETPDEAIARLDDIGGPHSHTNYPWGWAQCGNAPFRWYKQNTHEGGVHVPLIVRWPAGLGDQAGTVRHQFAHASDVAPTVYDLVGVTPPSTYRGVEQRPVTGRSFASVLHDADAAATNTVQYFEMAGSRAIVRERHKAVCKHDKGADFDAERWELYDLVDDPSECHDLADERPELLAELVELWWAEAEVNQVPPLDDRLIELFGTRFRPRSPHPESRRYTYRPSPWPMPAQAGASIGGRDFDLVARITRGPDDGGVLFATGTENSGLSVFVQDGRWVLDYNAFDDHTVVVSDVEVPVGDSMLTLRVRRGEGSTGTVALEVDGAPAGSADLPLLMRIMSSVGASIGRDHGSAVSQRYTGPFPFTGTLHELAIQVSPGRYPDVESAEAAEALSRQ
ncbi:arylsulfatase [Dermatobacter hominis]|uniref:arylsulfatase n=1 Tax=Dermatobacter hominis TaxID=2884263 RepID=UPI001D111B19|nr:arylsulfatase [Dermatobacter hominis]UDY36578.1 arylsulfatase [Dermatobacter hominis]